MIRVGFNFEDLRSAIKLYFGGNEVKFDILKANFRPSLTDAGVYCLIKLSVFTDDIINAQRDNGVEMGYNRFSYNSLCTNLQLFVDEHAARFGTSFGISKIVFDRDRPLNIVQSIIDAEFYTNDLICVGHTKNSVPEIKDVIFNDPATIVFWKDGTKTVVKAENEVFDKEKGLAMAICKRMGGNNGRYFEVFKKHCTRNKESDPNIYSEFEALRNQRDNLLLYLQYACSNNKELLSNLLTTFDGCPGFIYEENKPMEKETTTVKD